MKKRTHSIDVLFTMILFAIFFIMSVLLVMIGSNVYGNIVDRQESNDEIRTTLNYVAGKVKTCNVENGVDIETMEGTPVLTIKNDEGSYVVKTIIYFKDGYLREAAIMDGDQYNLGFGEEVIKTTGFSFEILKDKGILRLTMTMKDKSTQFTDVFIGKAQ